MAEAAKDTRLNAWKAEEMGYERETPYDIYVDNTAGIIFQAKMNAASRLKGIFDLRWYRGGAYCESMKVRGKQRR